MAQHLADHWFFEIDAAFTRRDDEDGFAIFERPGFELRAVVYCEQPFDSEKAVRRYFGNSRPSEFPFQGADVRTAGRATLERMHERWELNAVAASFGRLAVLWFRFDARDDLEVALSIWNSLRYSPPEWIVKCADAVPPLAELREAVERGIFIPQALDVVLDRNQAADAVPAMLATLGNQSPTVRKSGCEALGLLGDACPLVIAAIRERLGDESIEVRAWAADALFELGQPAEMVVPAMIEGLQKKEMPLPAGESRITGICQFLSVPDRYHAARILWSIGEAASPAKDALLNCQMDESGGVREMVARALVNLQEPLSSVLPPLVQGLQSPEMSNRERMGIAETMRSLGAPPEDFLPVVVQVLDRSQDFSAISYALDVVKAVGADASIAAPVIERLIREHPERENFKLQAAQVLRQIGIKSDVAEAILSAASDVDDVDE